MGWSADRTEQLGKGQTRRKMHIKKKKVKDLSQKSNKMKENEQED